MVNIMNRKEFINKLSLTTSLSITDCNQISEILEDNFFFNDQNKQKIIDEIIVKLNIDNEKATTIYEKAINIIKEEIKNKLKHPFKDKD